MKRANKKTLEAKSSVFHLILFFVKKGINGL